MHNPHNPCNVRWSEQTNTYSIVPSTPINASKKRYPGTPYPFGGEALHYAAATTNHGDSPMGPLPPPNWAQGAFIEEESNEDTTQGGTQNAMTLYSNRKRQRTDDESPSRTASSRANTAPATATKGKAPMIPREPSTSLFTQEPVAAGPVVPTRPPIPLRQDELDIDFNTHLASMHAFTPLPDDSNSSPTTTLTPRPPNGFPKVHGDRVLPKLANIEANQVRLWKAMKCGKVLIQVYGFTATPSDYLHYLRETLAWAIKDLCGIPTVFITQPIPATLSTAARDQPRTFLAHGFDEGVQEQLIAQYCCSTQYITFFCSRFEWEAPTFVCGIIGLDDTHKGTLVRTIGRRLDTPDTRDLITRLARDHPTLRLITPEEAILRVLSSLHVETIPTKGKHGVLVPTTNIYLTPPAIHPIPWREWRDHVFRINWGYGQPGPAYGAPPRNCDGCHGADHPRGLCPYPLLPGWNGPAPTTIHPGAPSRPTVSVYSAHFFGNGVVTRPDDQPRGRGGGGSRHGRGGPRGSNRGGRGMAGRGQGRLTANADPF